MRVVPAVCCDKFCLCVVCLVFVCFLGTVGGGSAVFVVCKR